jgi:hypothetical protein
MPGDFEIDRLAAAFFAAGFLAAGFLAAGFFAAGFFAVGLTGGLPIPGKVRHDFADRRAATHG